MCVVGFLFLYTLRKNKKHRVCSECHPLPWVLPSTLGPTANMRTSKKKEQLWMHALPEVQCVQHHVCSMDALRALATTSECLLFQIPP